MVSLALGNKWYKFLYRSKLVDFDFSDSWLFRLFWCSMRRGQMLLKAERERERDDQLEKTKDKEREAPRHHQNQKT